MKDIKEISLVDGNSSMVTFSGLNEREVSIELADSVDSDNLLRIPRGVFRNAVLLLNEIFYGE